MAGAIVVAVIASSLPSLGLGNNNNQLGSGGEESGVIRIGYFANMNHAQAVIGLGRGDFHRTLQGTEVRSQVFNAGPSVIEAMLANHIDVAYIGPNPAINGYMVSDGSLLRIISGAASGGAVFVVRNDAGIQSTADFADKKFSSPQLGNTQDVALRKYLLDNGYQTKENGGSVEVLPAHNSDIVTLMIKKEIDGAWVPEPWGAKLVKEANARIFLDERALWPEGEFVTAHVIARTEYLEHNPGIIKKFLKAHVDETEWINNNQEEAVKAFNQELKKLTGKSIPEDELVEGLSRMKLTSDPVKESLFQSAEDAIEIGFLESEGLDLEGIYELDLLNEVLAEQGQAVLE
ncbi:MAG: ABC transporter substrate-binding protein [Nitrososphaera sp.]|nr:ABC transporter substrate-binding protein [Nitrososphaera sp.]